MTIWYILCSFGTFFRFGVLCQEKSGNPAQECVLQKNLCIACTHFKLRKMWQKMFFTLTQNSINHDSNYIFLLLLQSNNESLLRRPMQLVSENIVSQQTKRFKVNQVLI
jgi:hypothetical protein